MGSIVTAGLVLGREMLVKNSTPSSCSALRKTFPQLFPTNPPFVAQRGDLKTQKTKRKFPVGWAQFWGKRWGEVEVHLFFGISSWMKIFRCGNYHMTIYRNEIYHVNMCTYNISI